jgi:lipopolysaccharide export system permease protein
LILKNYINRDIYKATGAILLVLILIFVSSRFVKYIQLAVDGTISAGAVFSLLALQIPSVAGFLIPLSFFLAILLTFGRLYSDNELVVVHGLGLGQKDLAKILMPAALSLAVVAGLLSTFLTPWAASQSSILMAEQAAQAKLGIFSAGRFRENSNKDGIVFVESKSEDGQITGVFSVSRQQVKDSKPVSNDNELENQNIEAAPQGTLLGDSLGQSLGQSLATEVPSFHTELKIQTAKTGRHWEDEETGVSYLVLENGQLGDYNQQSDQWQLTNFESTYTRIVQDDDIEVKERAKSTSTIELLRSLSGKSWAEIHWRLAAPISIPLVCLLAVPLARTRPRQGKFSRLLPSIMIYLIYVLLMMYSRKMIEADRIPGELGFWWIHAGMALFIYWLYRPKNRAVKRNAAAKSAKVS